MTLTRNPPVGRATRAAALVRPAGLAAAALAAVAYVGAVDPNRPGRYPTCPFHALTGLWCPGCGSLRAVHALAHGDLGTAVGLNVLMVASLPLLGWIWLSWVRRELRGGPPRRPAPAALVVALAVVAIVFGVARNLPFASALAP